MAETITGRLFRPIRNNRTGELDHQADIAKVQEWLGHAHVATTRIYDHRKTRPEDRPTYKVNY
jgi:integrase/recombinase XerD